MKMNYQGNDAMIDIKKVTVEFPSVYDKSLEDRMIRMPSDYVLVSFFGCAFVSFGFYSIMALFRVKIKAEEDKL